MLEKHQAANFSDRGIVEMVKEKCDPCVDGATVDTARNICSLIGDKEKCKKLFEKVRDGKISVNEYLKKISKLAKHNFTASKAIEDLKAIREKYAKH
mgnify:CR=1 FL=1